MKARIICENNWFYGQVYGTWYNPLLSYLYSKKVEWTGWNTVTIGCFTRLGAKYELYKWKKKNISEDFEL